MITERDLRKRIDILTKEQCEYIVKTLRFIPYSVQDWTTSVPYYYLDSDAEEIIPIPVGRGGHDCQPWWDYMEDVADEWQRERFDTGYGRPPLSMHDSMPPTQKYLRNTVRAFCHRPKFKTTEPLPEFGMDKDPQTAWFHYQTRTALNTPTMDHVIEDFVEYCMRPLALLIPDAMKLYIMGEKQPDELPCGSFIGKGMSSVIELWKMLGGSVDEYEMPDSMPWWCHLRVWTMPNDWYEKYVHAINYLINRALRDWRMDYLSWVKDMPDFDSEPDFLEAMYRFNHFVRAYEPKDEDEDEEENEEEPHVILGEDHKPIPAELD